MIFLKDLKFTLSSQRTGVRPWISHQYSHLINPNPLLTKKKDLGIFQIGYNQSGIPPFSQVFKNKTYLSITSFKTSKGRNQRGDKQRAQF